MVQKEHMCVQYEAQLKPHKSCSKEVDQAPTTRQPKRQPKVRESRKLVCWRENVDQEKLLLLIYHIFLGKKRLHLPTLLACTARATQLPGKQLRDTKSM